MASEKGLAYQLDWGDRTMSPPPPSLPLVCRPPPPPPPTLSALPPPLLPLPAPRAVKERLETAGRRAGAARAGAVASFPPPTRPRGLRGALALALALVLAPRPGARWGKVEARGRACGDAEPEHRVTGGLEGGDLACPGRVASGGPTRRPVPAPAARAPQKRALGPSWAVRTPSGFCTLAVGSRRLPTLLRPLSADPLTSDPHVHASGGQRAFGGQASPWVSRQPCPRGRRVRRAGPGARCPPTALSVVASARRSSGPGLRRPGHVSGETSPGPAALARLPPAPSWPQGSRLPGPTEKLESLPRPGAVKHSRSKSLGEGDAAQACGALAPAPSAPSPPAPHRHPAPGWVGPGARRGRGAGA